MTRMKIIRLSLIGIAAICFLFFVGSLVIKYLTPDLVQPSLMNGKLYIYDDFASSYNHYRVKGAIASGGQESLVHPMDDNYKGIVYSGETAIRSQVDVLNDSWGGWLFTYGYHGPFASQNNLNWGDHPNCGYNLTGAKSLTFMARGEKGGERVEFFFGGLGWNPETGRRVKPYADSTPKLSIGVVTLTDEFTEYTIPLEQADLSYITSAFGFVVSGNYNKENVVFYLDDIKIDFSGQMLKQPEKVWFNLDNTLSAIVSALAIIIAAYIGRGPRTRERSREASQARPGNKTSKRNGQKR